VNVIYLRVWIFFANSCNLRETKLKLNPKLEIENWKICIYLYRLEAIKFNFRPLNDVTRASSISHQNMQKCQLWAQFSIRSGQQNSMCDISKWSGGNGLDKKNGYPKFRFSSTSRYTYVIYQLRAPYGKIFCRGWEICLRMLSSI
jgi:hypothetical protein